jgi:hypothetical protein
MKSLPNNALPLSTKALIQLSVLVEGALNATNFF